MIEEDPQTWRISDLGKIAKQFISGGTPSTKEPEFWDGDIPWTTSAPISDTDIFLDCGQRFITLEGLENSASHLVPKGNLLVGTRVGVGKAVVNLIDIAISQDLTGIVLNSSVTPAFIAYQFKTQRVTSFFFGRKRGTTIKGIARLDLHALPLSIPPLTEQQAIVKALRAVQEAREARRREAALERERKAALMDYLFNHGTLGEPRQQTEIGEIPQSWQVVELRAMVKVKGGKRLPKGAAFSREPTEFPYIRIVDFINGSVKTQGLKYLSKDLYEVIKNYTISKDDIYISIAGTIGIVGTIPPELDGANLTENAAKLIILNNNTINKDFLARYLGGNRGQSQIGNLTTKTTQPKLALTRIEQIKVPIPAFNEQKEIAETLGACDAKIAALEQETALLEELFRAMLEELMTGRLSALPLVEAEGTA